MRTSRQQDLDERMMKECLRLAQRGVGRVSPNPLVGAVLAEGERIIASGFHRRFGGPHAEVECLRKVDKVTRRATLYVNLEPCVHHGKTPPCVDLVLRSGVHRVVVGMKDPNPLVAGRGIRFLRRHGIRVDLGVLEEQARDLNERFVTFITRHRPYVHLKVAQSMDGRIASPLLKGRWISSLASRRLVHEWRAEYDAVLVGAGTVAIDDPLLTVRLARGRNPDVVVLDGLLSTRASARVYNQRQNRRVFLCTSVRAATKQGKRVKALEKRGVIVLQFRSSTGLLDLKSVLEELARRDIGSLMVEGGAEVFSRFMRTGLVDQMSQFIAPMTLGAGAAAFSDIPRTAVQMKPRKPHRTQISIVGQDILLLSKFS